MASIPQAKGLNGATVLTGALDTVLIADSALGAIWRVIITTGEVTQVIQEDLFAASDSIPLGINGIKTRGGNLYFINSAQGIFGTVPISMTLGTATGPIRTIATLPDNLVAYNILPWIRPERLGHSPPERLAENIAIETAVSRGRP